MEYNQRWITLKVEREEEAEGKAVAITAELWVLEYSECLERLYIVRIQIIHITVNL